MAKNKHNNRKNKKSNQMPSDGAGLHSPPHFPDVNTPDSTSSLVITPSELTPVAALDHHALEPVDADPEAITAASVDPNYSRSEYDGSSPQDAPAADVHSKLKEKTPPSSRTNLASSVFTSFGTSKLLQEVTLHQPPKPYATPPQMPHDLEQRFVASLQEYGVDLQMKGQSPIDIIRQARETEAKQKMQSDTEHKPAQQPAQQPSSLHHNYDIQPTAATSSTNIPHPRGPAPSVLFPSPRLQRQPSWDFVQTKPGNIAPQGFMPGAYIPAIHGTPPFPMPFLEERQQMLPVPQITIQPPSPTKEPASRKRGPSQSSDQFGPALIKAQLTEETTGLPVLAVDKEEMWKEEFPGNTEALMTIMLPWSVSMTRLHAQLNDAHLFSINAAFPYRVQPPITHKLVSAAFYDDKHTPHREIRFLGPGHDVDITYHEVDTFTYPDETPVHPAQALHKAKMDAAKRAVGIHVPYKDAKHMSMRHRAEVGEGRWAYILIQAHHSAYPGATPPHVMMAWHASAVTRSSKCLHTIYPGGSNAPKPAAVPPPKGLKRFSSLQNLRKELRSASSAELPRVEEAAAVVQEGARTLLREVWKMEKGGRVPLVEGYRVDVGAWREWMAAVAGGRGKVVVWREME